MLAHWLVRVGARVAESHPYAWWVAWHAVRRLPFLLPHDKSYGALKHFIELAPRRLFLDVGANDGISVLSFRKFHATYPILSLEPNLLLEPALRKLTAKDPHMEYRMIGAGSAPARVQFFVPSYNGVMLHTFTSSCRSNVERAIAHAFGESVAARIKFTKVGGEIVRVDDLGIDPSIVKIDAEGSDLEVLIGMRETIARTRPFLMVEIAWDDDKRIVDFLCGEKYLLFSYDESADIFALTTTVHSSGSGYRNVFAVPEEKSSLLPVSSKPITLNAPHSARRMF